MVLTLAEIRSNLSDTTHETQIDDLIDSYINLTIDEINDPAWAFELLRTGKGYNHNWSFNRRKHTLTTVADQEFYQLPRDVDKIGLIRQTTAPIKLRYYPDFIFYKAVPNPETTGNPRYYRLWEEEGVETRLSADDTISIVSSSTSDGSSITVSIVGEDSNGVPQTESLSLNGTTAVTGTITWNSGKPLRVSKSGDTDGNITVKEVTSSTTLVILGRRERAPRFKVVGFYPIPSSAISIYIEYYTRIRRLVNDADVPNMNENWIWVIQLGALAKIRDYQGKDEAFQLKRNYAAAVRGMVKADMQNVDYVPRMRRHGFQKIGMVELADDEYSLTY